MWSFFICFGFLVTELIGGEPHEESVERRVKNEESCFIDPKLFFYISRPYKISSSVKYKTQQMSCRKPYSKPDGWTLERGTDPDPHTSTRTEQHQGQDRASSVLLSTALAIVPYKEENILPHERPVRTFHLAGRDFHIHQDWQGGGVAAVVWDAAVVLAEYLSDNVSFITGKTILELGAGTGLTGMVAASLGAKVIATERAEAIPHLQASIALNCNREEWNIATEVLDWTADIDTSIWHDFDIVLGADIIYIEDTFTDLLRTLTKVAPDSKTNIILSCRIRYDRDTRFLNMLKQLYNIEEVMYSSKMDVKVFSLIRKPFS